MLDLDTTFIVVFVTRCKYSKSGKRKSLTQAGFDGGDDSVGIKYSMETQNYYVHMPCMILNDIGELEPISEHRETIDKAMVAILEKIEGRTLIFNDGTSERKGVFFFAACRRP